jgi:phospholipase C
MIKYALPGDKEYQQQLYPEPNPDGIDDPNRLDPRLGLKTYNDVIAHFTKSSLERDGIEIEPDSLSVTENTRGYTVSFEPKRKFATEAEHFKKMHVQMLDHDHAGLALRGVEECRKTPAWNPMANYKVKPTQPKSEWRLFLPLGMPIVNHRAITLLHYPPTIAYHEADYFKAATAQHWMQIVKCCVPHDIRQYQLIIDVNPIAAPGSGESEYENDYFPINLTSLFFDNDKKGLTYVRSILELMLNPPHNEGNPYTLPLLVGGSPEYDPQAPGWFRTRYKEQLPKDEDGIPLASVLQADFIYIKKNSKKKTPYIIANHMAAAGVKGKCTDDLTKSIQRYEAQDLVAATFLTTYAHGKETNPAEALKDACQRWFGATDGSGAPNPLKEEDRLTICALAQVDQFLTKVVEQTGQSTDHHASGLSLPAFKPKYSYQEAIARCQRRGGPEYSPCFGSGYVAPDDPVPWEDTAMGLRSVRGDYLICRSTETDNYSVWRLDMDHDQVRFSLMPGQKDAKFRMPGQEEAHFDPSRPKFRPQLISIGNYILEWWPLTLEQYSAKGLFPYRLLRFDPSNGDPLNFAVVKSGFWEKKKFWLGRPDFGNPEGAAKAYDKGDKLMLVPLGTYVLNIIPTTGRGTFKLFNFDPGSNDPLTPFPTMIFGSFETIQFGHELIPLGNYVLDRIVDPQAPADQKGRYWLWSFDPMDATPLARPAIQTGHWHDIDENHQLIPLDEEYLLDWNMKGGTYRLFRFDPHSRNPESTNPLAHTPIEGPMPREFRAEMTKEGLKGNILTSVQTLRPIDQKKKTQPGTIDFMRTNIKHVVYYILENCSFDNVCGWLYEKGEQGINWVPSDCERPFKGAKHAQMLGCDFNLNPDDLSVDPDDPDNSAKKGPPRKVYLEKFTYRGGKLEFLRTDPYHDMTDTMRQCFFKDRNGYASHRVPDMGGFVWNNGDSKVMWTYTPEQLRVLNGLASAFAISDEWFCSMPGATDSQRAFALTGSSLRQLDNFQNDVQYVHWPDNPHRPSIWKVLWANGFTDWKIYYSVTWPNKPGETPFVLTYHLFLENQIASVDANINKYIAGVDQFKEDARTGNLPAFSFLEPVWIMSDKPATSYHPSGSDGKGAGEVALNEIYEALKAGPHWNQTLLVITFDEHGGLFDHVPPHYAHNPWPRDENDGFKYDLMGVRVPTILVSPWIKKHTVFRSRDKKVPYDSTSILATLLRWYGIPKARWGLGERTHHAPTFETVFECEFPRNDAPELQALASYESEADGPGRVRRSDEEHAWRMVTYAASRIGKKRTHDACRIADDVLGKATDVEDLWKRMNDLLKRLRD